VAAAGPLANLVVASVAAVAFRGFVLSGVATGPGDFVWQLLFAIVQFNIILGLFNLLPIPPLDGYNLVLPFLPANVAYQVQRYAPYGVLVLLLMVLLPQMGAGGLNPLGWLFTAASTITVVLTGV
jgi:Zn-dependent protease